MRPRPAHMLGSLAVFLIAVSCAFLSPTPNPSPTGRPAPKVTHSATPEPLRAFDPKCPGRLPSDPPHVCRKGPNLTATSIASLLYLTPGPEASRYTQQTQWARQDAATEYANATHDALTELTRTALPFVRSTPLPFDPMATSIASTEGFPWVAWLDNDAPLEPAGPWLVYFSPHEYGLVARNDDGSGETRLWSGSIGPGDLVSAPSGGRVAFRPDNQPKPEPGGWAPSDHAFVSYKRDVAEPSYLLVIRIPSGDIEARLELLAEEVKDLGYSYDGWATVDTAIRQLPVWSPDGRYLAYVAALEAPNTDVYVYDTETRNSRRLTTGQEHAISPSWSPDSKWILHQEISTVGTGAGWNGGPLWAARPDGSEVRLVQELERGQEKVHGWTSRTTFLVSSWSADVGPYDLREVHVENGGQRMVYPGPLPFFTMSLDHRIMLVGYHPAHEPSWLGERWPAPSGLYLRPFDQQELTPLLSLSEEDSGDLRAISWDSAIQRFIVQFRDRVLSFDIAGRLHANRVVPEEWHNTYEGDWEYASSPNGQRIAVPGGRQGLVLCTPDFDCDVSINSGLSSPYAEWVLWSPESNYLFFSNGAWNTVVGVAHIPFRELRTDRSLEIYGPHDFAWVEP